MKITYIAFLSFLLSIAGCMIFKHISSKEHMRVMAAKYTHWSEAPVNSDVPESGTDLTLRVQDWPEDASPSYIIFQHRKSFRAEITDTTDQGVEISARIVHTSSVLRDKSQKTDLSDRLIYTTTDGNKDFVKIKEWNKKQE